MGASKEETEKQFRIYSRTPALASETAQKLFSEMRDYRLPSEFR